MERQAMYQFLQACLMGQTDYTTTDGVTFYRAPTSGERQHGIVLDVLIDRYLCQPGQAIELSVPDIAVSIDVSADEIVRTRTRPHHSRLATYRGEIDSCRLGGHR